MIIKFNADVVRTTASVVGVRWGLWASGAMRYCGAAPPPREVRLAIGAPFPPQEKQRSRREFRELLI